MNWKKRLNTVTSSARGGVELANANSKCWYGMTRVRYPGLGAIICFPETAAWSHALDC
jgi:hypothetical protein